MPLKKGLLEALEAASQAHPEKTIRLYFQDEARVGQKGRLCHRWWPKGQRATGLCDRRFESTYIFGAVAPETGDAFGLILPQANTSTMLACPLQTTPAAMRAAGAMKEVIDAAQEAHGRGDHWQAA